ncbi:uncharacterized protein LOC120843107 [Ixodes scapularis]|uniref:uncharacterized protein LOC120843107 n=1 Tax=Ixodes scapularis TaxID=6945 RepID=UPI001A9EA843|nr:uncharacterized protein LOC120843107 [Ixodes scapularis]
MQPAESPTREVSWNRGLYLEDRTSLPQQFKEHFRMNRSTFEVLLKIPQQQMVTQTTPRIPVATNVLVTLWLLGNQEPYRNNGHLSEEQVTYNETLSAARSVIERAFAQLKGKSRRLKYLDMKATEMMSKYVLVSCVLHNIILQSKEPFVVEIQRRRRFIW